MGRQSFRSGWMAWLSMIWERLEALDGPDSFSDAPIQSSSFTLELWRLRREFQLMERSAHIQCSMGLVDSTLRERVPAFLHDLQWLLHVSPTVSPAMARQCVRMAQDRVFDEVQVLSRHDAADEIREQTRISMSAAPAA
jgi:hypothetical protein